MEAAGVGGSRWSGRSGRKRVEVGRSGWKRPEWKDEGGSGWKGPEWEDEGGSARVGGSRWKQPEWEDTGGSVW
jgi:hypothetical protein